MQETVDAADDMTIAAHPELLRTDISPWYVVQADDKRRARLNCIAHLLSLIPHKRIKREKVVLPDRQKAHGYEEPKYDYKFVPEKY